MLVFNLPPEASVIDLLKLSSEQMIKAIIDYRCIVAKLWLAFVEQYPVGPINEKRKQDLYYKKNLW